MRKTDDRACLPFESGNALSVLLDASRQVAQSEEPLTLVADGGVENSNADVDDLIDSGTLQRLLATADISVSIH